LTLVLWDHTIWYACCSTTRHGLGEVRVIIALESHHAKLLPSVCRMISLHSMYHPLGCAAIAKSFRLDVISSCTKGVLTAAVQVQGLSSSCCGMMFNSRGFKGAASHMGQQLEQSLVKASDGGKIPIVMDTSPCLAQMKGALTDPALRSACWLDHKQQCCSHSVTG